MQDLSQAADASKTSPLSMEDAGEPLIRGRGICLTRAGRVILDHIDIDVSPGEIVTLIGPNGAGKTTLARVLLGLVKYDSGTIRRRADLVVGYVPQKFEPDPAIPMSVARFLAPARNTPAARIRAALAEVSAERLYDSQLYLLSGGELQRVLLARALLRDPHLLVLDEPVQGVDHMGEAELYRLIARIRSERGVGVLLVSHDLHVVMGQSDRVICLNRHVCCSGVPAAVSRNPEYARLFGTRAAELFGLYEHHHDHRHDLAGDPLPAKGDAHVHSEDCKH